MVGKLYKPLSYPDIESERSDISISNKESPTHGVCVQMGVEPWESKNAFFGKVSFNNCATPPLSPLLFSRHPPIPDGGCSDRPSCGSAAAADDGAGTIPLPECLS